MIAAKHQRHETLRERSLRHLGEAAAGLGDFMQIFGALVAVVLFLGLLHGNVADVFHRMAERLQALLESRDAQCGRAHVHTAAALAEVHRYSDDANF